MEFNLFRIEGLDEVARNTAVVHESQHCIIFV